MIRNKNLYNSMYFLKNIVSKEEKNISKRNDSAIEKEGKK